MNSDFETSLYGVIRTFDEELIERDAGGMRLKGLRYWFADELYSHKKIFEYPIHQVFRFIDREDGQNGHRIDRINWHFDEKLVFDDWYFDCHSVRPYTEHKKDIDRLVELALLERPTIKLRLKWLIKKVLGR